MVETEVKEIAIKNKDSNTVSFDYEKTPITQIADYIIINASNRNSSDIHFDPREDGMMVRFRIDGELQDYTFVPKTYERNLVTRLKLISNMNITESRLPQDGAIKGTFGGKELDMRVSCLPLNEGEKVVIRILDYTRSLQGIDSLGFNKANLAKLKRMMGVPNGIILVTGATGSGKSTTTYSILQGLNKPEINIITVEDPIEMNIEGMNQVQVNAEIGMTFAAALRSILRQDPNVILIGEIRDSETAQIAVRASITGHLVLSTIHTNNSLATIERLLDMDVERYLLSTALTGIISQRLAKKLCTKCRIQRPTTKYEKKVFKKYMHTDVDIIWDANPKGCDSCRRGYKGRIAIQEVLEIDDEIRNALNNEKLKKEDLSNMVYTDKTITMLQDALGKALAGLTSFEEVYRVIEIENDDDDSGGELTKAIEETTTPVTEPEKVVEKKEVNITPTAVTKADQTIKIPTNNVAPQKQVPVNTTPGQITTATVKTVTTTAPNVKEIPKNINPVDVANVQTVNPAPINKTIINQNKIANATPGPKQIQPSQVIKQYPVPQQQIAKPINQQVPVQQTAKPINQQVPVQQQITKPVTQQAAINQTVKTPGQVINNRQIPNQQQVIRNAPVQQPQQIPQNQQQVRTGQVVIPTIKQ